MKGPLEMITVEQALERVLQNVGTMEPQTTALTSSALGLVLAEEIASDRDMPPFAKSLMDGYAVRSEDIAADGADLIVVEEIYAGHSPQKKIGKGQGAHIMTGAPLPEGADAVVASERTEKVEEQRVRIKEGPIAAGHNVLPQAREMRRGDVVLKAGTVLRPQEFGLLAMVGKTAVKVFSAPIAAILSTGDEIVEPSIQPGPSQIRNSNAYMLAGQIVRAGGTPRYLGIARDTLHSLRPLVMEGLKAHVLVLTGGVSAGKVDYVPAVLQENGVEPIFHKVRMKPGKPLFFGKRGDTLVFGLPGNPVSALVGFELFVRPAIRRLMGFADAGPKFLEAQLKEPFDYATDRPTYHPAHLEWHSNCWQASPIPWFGSADLRGVARANAFMLLSAEQSKYLAGSNVRVLVPEPII